MKTPQPALMRTPKPASVKTPQPTSMRIPKPASVKTPQPASMRTSQGAAWTPQPALRRRTPVRGVRMMQLPYTIQVETVNSPLSLSRETMMIPQQVLKTPQQATASAAHHVRAYYLTSQCSFTSTCAPSPGPPTLTLPSTVQWALTYPRGRDLAPNAPHPYSRSRLASALLSLRRGESGVVCVRATCLLLTATVTCDLSVLYTV